MHALAKDDLLDGHASAVDLSNSLGAIQAVQTIDSKTLSKSCDT